TLIGGVAWVVSFGLAGYFLGTYEFVKTNLSAIVFALIIITIIPAIVAVLRKKVMKKKEVEL
ncbi:MAG: hypothetical protein AAB316_12315, partial [Bacteroidota bacterium]